MIVNDAGRRSRTTQGSGSGSDLWVYGRHRAPCRRCGRPIGRRIGRRIQGPDRAPTLALPSGARNASPCPADQTPALEAERGRELR
jgi:hypothetical protein